MIIQKGTLFYYHMYCPQNELLWATDVGDGAPDVPLCCAHAVGKVYLSSFGKIIRDNIHRANSVYDDKRYCNMS